MAKVCVVNEYFEEEYDESTRYHTVIAVAVNRTIGERMIEERKNKRINEALSSGGMVTDCNEEYGDDVYSPIEIKYDKGNKFFYMESYFWTIEEFDIIES